MAGYIKTIEQAVYLFPIIALLLAVPYFYYQYKKYGIIEIKKSLYVFAFIFYLICCYCLVILPLPDYESVLNSTGPYTDFRWFGFIPDFFEFSGIGTLGLMDVLKSPWFYIPLFNFLMLIPFGIFLKRLFKASLIKTVLLAFLLSLSFELIQLSGLFGIYPHPYRLFQLDDLILNTLGAFIGYLICPEPGSENLKIREKNPFSPVFKARACVFIMDVIGVSFLMRLLAAFLGRPVTTGLFLSDLLLFWIAAVFYFIILTWFFGAQTPAGHLFGLKYLNRRLKKPKFLPFLIRQSFLFLVILPMPMAGIDLLSSNLPAIFKIPAGFFLLLLPLIVVLQILLAGKPIIEDYTRTYCVNELKVDKYLSRYQSVSSPSSVQDHRRSDHVLP